MNERRNRKEEQMGGRGETGRMANCHDAKWWVAASGDPTAKLSVWTPSWGGDGRLEVCDPRVRKPLLRRHYSKKLLLQLKCTCWKQACVHTPMSKVCRSWRLSMELPMRRSMCSMLQTYSGKKGGIILPFGGCRGERKESSSPDFSVSSQNLLLCCCLADP